MRIGLVITAIAAILGACTLAPRPAAGPPNAPAPTTSTSSATTPSAPATRTGKIETLAAAVIGHMNTGDGQGQGLTSNRETLLESTNIDGTGGIRELNAETGAPHIRLADQPGRTASGLAVTTRPGTPGTVWQLTLRDHIAIARDHATLTPQREVAFDGEGWGLCDDGTQLVQSDGTMRLTLRDASTFAQTGTIEVTGGWWTTSRLGELECVRHNGHRVVWANLAGTSWLLRIDLDAEGAVTAVADLSPALAAVTTTATDAPINGIAATTTATNEFWITGNGWKSPLRIRLTPRP